jgi:hypothetical protein
MGDRRRPNQQDKSKRGRHKKARSKEVKVWVEEAACPDPPDWMDESTYQKLAALRREVDLLR